MYSVYIVQSVLSKNTMNTVDHVLLNRSNTWIAIELTCAAYQCFLVKDHWSKSEVKISMPFLLYPVTVNSKQYFSKANESQHKGSCSVSAKLAQILPCTLLAWTFFILVGFLNGPKAIYFWRKVVYTVRNVHGIFIVCGDFTMYQAAVYHLLSGYM
jgi:hypothetical protein